jgi:hypothetical protein
MSGPTIFVRFSKGLAAFLFLPFEIRTGHFLTSLDRFIAIKIFFIAIKRFRLVTGHECPVFGRSGYQMVGIGIRYNPNTARGSVFGGVLYDHSDHSY